MDCPSVVREGMTAPTHIVTGLATVVVLGRVAGETPDAVNLLVLLVGSLAPDIDGNGAITRPGTILRTLIGRELASVIDDVFEFISEAIQFVFEHRGFLHSPFVAFCIFALGGFLEMHWLEWFALGYASIYLAMQ